MDASPMTFPQMYERFLVEPLFRPWVDIVFERAGLVAGDRLLDVACGTGIVARVAAQRLGGAARIVGVDLNPQMLDVARTVAPGIDWREGNACALPVSASERFDLVVCQQGLQFFPDKPAATLEMRRVLAPGGRVAIAAWRPLSDIAFLQELHRVAERHLGPVLDRRHGFGDAAALGALLAEAGFTDARVETVSRTIRLANPAMYVRMNAMALVGMSTASAAMDEAQRAQAVSAIAEDSAEVLSNYMEGEGLAFELSTNLAIARS